MRNTPLLIAKAVIASLFIAALVWWAQVHLDWRDVLSAWQRVSVLDVALVVALILLSHCLRVLRVFLAYRRLQAVSFINVSGVSLSHNTISFLLPMRLGELALPLLSRKKLDISYSYSSATLLLLRVFDAHWLLILLSITASSSYLSDQANSIIWFIIASTPIVLAVLIYFLAKAPRFSSIRPLVQSPSLLIMLYLCTGAIWLVKLSALAWLASVLGQIDIQHAWLATILADASALSPITGFANAGTFEAAFALPLLPLGYDSAVLVGAALNLHLLVLVTNICAGLIGALILTFNKSEKQVP